EEEQPPGCEPRVIASDGPIDRLDLGHEWILQLRCVCNDREARFAGGLAFRPMTTFDVDALRGRFPALALTHRDRPMAFFDGPGGTQVPNTVIEAVSRYYRESNANAD